MRYRIGTLVLLWIWTLAGLAHAENAEKTAFQTGSPWMPELDLRSDVAIVYGVNPSFAARVKSWRDRGYAIHMMTGVAWGGYQEYLDGRFDGEKHWNEGQVDRQGNMIMHGGGVPYMVPTPQYVAYLKTLLKQAIDEGATAVHLEEPEFWNRGGYSDGFKREWQAFYGEPWQPQHASPEATYRSARLKYHLYFRALRELFRYAKEYGAEQGRRVRAYVPTHSLLNYASWGIVSPESSLSNLPGMDGYIAQVWTGTARTPVFYNGVERERTFENAFLEYGSMVAMTKPTGRKVFFLTDPIEDNPNYTWSNYKKNYEDTFTAQLLHPSVSNYEVMPWPNRIFRGTYRVEGSTERRPIPADYATEILVLINALNDMPATDAPLPGTQGIGVLLSDTMMFQRFPTHGKEDPRLSDFYGMALPLLKHGIPVQLVQLENLPYEGALEGVRLLLMSYANMKPLEEGYHEALADWVRRGGILIYLGRDDDPYQTIREWWNQDGNAFAAPSEHLFALLGTRKQALLPAGADVADLIGHPVPLDGKAIGDGRVFYVPVNPKELAMRPEGGDRLRAWVRRALDEQGLGDLWQAKNVFRLQRGPYLIVAVLDESVSETPYRVEGPVIDLYDPALPVLDAKIVRPGERALLYSLAARPKLPSVLAAASRASEETRAEGAYAFTMKGPAGTKGIARVAVPSGPPHVEAADSEGNRVAIVADYDAPSRTLRVRYPNDPDGIRFRVTY